MSYVVVNTRHKGRMGTHHTAEEAIKDRNSRKGVGWIVVDSNADRIDCVRGGRPFRTT